MQVKINGKTVECQSNETILQVARREDVFIPTLCELADMNHTPGTCRVCLVEATRAGAEEPLVVTSCNTPVEEGMEIKTRTSKLREMQKLQVEMIMADHDQDCATCARHGNCELQDVAEFVGLKKSRFVNPKLANKRPVDNTSVSIVRDMSKCVRCQRCVAVCRDVQGIDALVLSGYGTDAQVTLRDNKTYPDSDCVSCGQCILVCPTGAMTERDEIDKVISYLEDPNIKTVFQFAPAVRVGFGEEFGIEEAKNVEGLIISALRKMGADIIMDTNFTADLVIMEEGTELLARLKEGKRPMFTSCCPGWINFAEKHYPDILPYLSTTKSPQNCLGALAKTYVPEKTGIDPKNIRVISIMPCTAKKDEAARPQLSVDGLPDIDVVLTIREFARLIRREGIDFKSLEPGEFDNPYMTDYSGAGAIFGATGGVMEAALRTVYYVLNGKELESIDIPAVRGPEGFRAATVHINDEVGDVKVAICHSLTEARKMVEKVLAKEVDFDFIEIMACPGGCINGGGHLKAKKRYKPFVKKRTDSLYKMDKGMNLRQSHNNPQIKAVYEDFLGQPNSEKAHHLLHTHYEDRKNIYHQKMKEIWTDIADTFAK